ncbi:quinon protein alcohol dehydrogenase-like superfamily [Cladochytrium replicatum]|nr:quinon protein alcohol dehydrogenase-like superfamily [Cladochytrium replicatum]
MEQRYVPGFRDASFSAIAVHPSKRYIAVAEGCSAAMAVPPNIYVLAYPELEVARLLRNGTSRSYADLCFDGVGDTLASVGGDPDYMLTIWSWRSEKVVLRNKAFSQDVFRVAFSPDAEGQLTTSGMGHIKFWKVASTFTGLKLQGLLGKFGVSELTDISSFVAFPDGKVLSSTETGNLLLWDGGMIKCEIAAKGVSSGEGAKKRGGCHAGKVEVVMLFDQEIVTAGDDGVVKVWDFEMVDAADVTTNYGPAGSGGGGGEEQGGQGGNSGGGMNQVRIFEIEPVDELPIGKDVKVKHMVRSPTTPSEYLLQDSLGGHVFRIDTHKRTTDKILSFHAGPVVACDTSPLGHALASLGDDGTLRIWDYITTRSCIAKLRLGNPEEPSSTHGTCLQYLPTSLDPLGCTVITGSNDGVIRIITHTPFPPPKDGKQPQACSLYLQFVFKPHAGGLSAIEVSADGTVLATGGEDGTIFFFGIEKSHGVGVQHGLGAPSAVPKWDFAPVEEGGQGGVKFTPIGFVKAESPPVRISFSPDNSDGFENDEEEEDEEEVDGEEGEDGDKKPEDGERRESNESVDAKGTSANRRKLLVVLRNGEMFTMISPDAQKVDSSLTFEIHSDAVDMKQWEVSVPIKKPVEAPKDPKQQVAQQPPTGVSPSTAPSDQPATAQQEPNETAPTTMIPSTTNLSVPNSMFIEMRKSRGLAIRTGSPIVNAIYLEGGYAILAFTNTNGEGELRVCRLKHPDRSRLLLVYKSPISTIRITTSAKYIVVGSVDGMVGLRKLRLEDIEWTQKFQPTEHEQFAKFLERLEAESQDTKSSGQNLEQVQGEGPAQDIDPTDSIGDLLRAQSRGKMAENEPAGHYWLGYPHGCRYGTVSMIATSFDDSYLLSAGNDGGLFSFRVTFEDVQRSECTFLVDTVNWSHLCH